MGERQWRRVGGGVLGFGFAGSRIRGFGLAEGEGFGRLPAAHLAVPAPWDAQRAGSAEVGAGRAAIGPAAVAWAKSRRKLGRD